MPELLERLSGALAARYKLQRELGQGGMAKVFLAHDLKYERAVAIKVLRPDLAAEVGPARFLREIQIAARLHHPHILPLYDSDQVDGLVYYVMPYIEGESLRERLARERQLPVNDALQIAREVADALSYAHSCNVVHRDIKPANILLDAGHALVADFGIARAIGSGESSTGHIIGTPAYMSPEQIDGSQYLDGRSDIYSLGCVLFEMLVGQAPFRGMTVTAVIANRLSAPVPSPRAFRELVPEAVDAAVRKAMANLPADRFSSAAQFADALGTPATVAIAVGAAQAMVQEAAAAKSVAVLPFENMSTDPENEYFSDGITDDIIAQLSKINALKVISRTSSMQYKKTTKKITAIAQELGVGAILEGSVRRAGQRVRIVVHLVEPASEKHLWGDTFDRQLTDIFEVQSEVAQQITGALSVALSPDEKKRVEKKATENADAYNLYLLGRFHVNKWSEADVLKGIECFQGAIAKDPGYAVAYAGLADAYELLSIGFSSKPPVEYLAQAKAMALKALEMDDTLAEAHTSLAYARWLGDLDWPGAERGFKRAIELKTSYVMAHEWYAEYLGALGRHDEALVEIKRAQQLDPLSVPVNRAVGWVLYFARRYDQAIEELQKTLAMSPDFLGARMVLWWVYVAKGAFQEAIVDIRREAERPGLRTVKKLMLGYACAAAGNLEEANGILWELESKLATEDRLALLFALLFTALDMKDQA
ncbi:MAG TPA: protein kinase, partial [Gemmatimonadales bacterium]|nr:protein kinase [Gemmatimonadales bacterium]